VRFCEELQPVDREQTNEMSLARGQTCRNPRLWTHCYVTQRHIGLSTDVSIVIAYQPEKFGVNPSRIATCRVVTDKHTDKHKGVTPW